MLNRAFVIASAVFMTGLAFNMAMAEDAAKPDQIVRAVDGVNLNEPTTGVGALMRDVGVSLSFHDPARIVRPGGDVALTQHADNDRRRYEVELAARGDAAGLPFDVGVAQRTTVRVTDDGNIGRTGGGLEARIGRGLRSLADNWETPTWDNPSWYFFIADDDEALTWTPSGRASEGGLGYREDRVEIGDTQIGVAIEAAGAQAALAYVQREVRSKNRTANEDFAGVTLTWRR